MNKKDFGQRMLNVCIRAIEDNKSKLIRIPDNYIAYEKIDKLQQATEIYSETKLWLPK